MKTPDQINLIVEALAKAQGQFVNPEKNKTVTTKTYAYDYADLPCLFDASRKPLSDNGLSHSAEFNFKIHPAIMTYYIYHTSGQFLSTEWPLFSQGDNKALAGEITYGKRHCFSALIGTAAEDDLDGAPEDGSISKDKEKKYVQAPKPISPVNPKPITPIVAVGPKLVPAPAVGGLGMAKEIMALCDSVGLPQKDLFIKCEEMFKTRNLTTLKQEQYETLKQSLQLIAAPPVVKPIAPVAVVVNPKEGRPPTQREMKEWEMEYYNASVDDLRCK